MSGRPWYAQYPDDYERKTSHLTMVQHGAYRLLLDQYYKTGRPLPADVPTLQRMCRASIVAEKQAISAVLAEFFTLESDGWHNKRADEELGKADEICERRSNAGRIAAAKRWQSHTETDGNRIASAMANASESQWQNDAHLHSTATVTKEEEKTKARERAVVLPEWLPSDTWKDFLDHRQRLKAPMTRRAQELAIAKLERLRADGGDPIAAIERSISQGWKGLFEDEPNAKRREKPMSDGLKEHKPRLGSEGIHELIEARRRGEILPHTGATNRIGEG